MSRVSAFAAVVFFVLASASVSADAIRGTPSCPPGARGRSSHAGIRCVPLPCNEAGACLSGFICGSRRVCTQTFSVPPAGRGAFRNGAQPHDEVLVLATCGPRERCTGTGRRTAPTVGEPTGLPSCQVALYCLPDIGAALFEPDPPAPSPSEPSPSEPSPPEPAESPSPAREAPFVPPLYVDPDAPPPDEGAGCAVTRTSAPSAPGLLILGLLMVARRRRRAGSK